MPAGCTIQRQLATHDESEAPRMPERERQKSGDDAGDDDEDVEMDKDEIDRLVKQLESPRRQPGRSQRTMWKCQIRGRADHRLDQEVDVNDQHQIPKWRSAATQKNNKKKKMKESPRSKNEMKNKEKPGSGYLSGQRGRFKHPSSIASTRPRTSTRSTARQEQWMA